MKRFQKFIPAFVSLIGAVVGVLLEYLIDGVPISMVHFVLAAILVAMFSSKKQSLLERKMILAYVFLLGLWIFDGFMYQNFNWLIIGFLGVWFLFDGYRLLTLKKREVNG